MADTVEAYPVSNEAPAVNDRRNTILETNQAVENVRQAYDNPTPEGRPRPEWVRGICPQCGDELVSNAYYVGGRGYLICHECWSSLGDSPTCGYRKIL